MGFVMVPTKKTKKRFIANLLLVGMFAELVSAAMLPMTLPIATTSLDYSNGGYSGTIPTEFGLLTNMAGPFRLK